MRERNRLRRGVVALAAVGLGTSVLAGAAPAAAAPSSGCVVTARLPARIALAQPLTRVPVRLASTCGELAHASFALQGPVQQEELFVWERPGRGETRTWLLDDFAPSGRYAMGQGSAYDSTLTDAPTGVAHTVVKRAARTYALARRTGTRVDLAIRALEYDSRRDAFVPRDGERAVVRFRRPGSQRWHWSRTVVLDDAGRGATSLWAGRVPRGISVQVAGTAEVWGGTAYRTR